jgi:hypothetical protein
VSRQVDRGVTGFDRFGGGVVAYSPVPAPVDHGAIGWTFDPADTQAGTILPTAGRVEVVRIRATAALVTNINLHVVTAGGTLTANQCLAALFTDAGVLLSATGNQATAWQSTGMKVCALSAAQAVTPGQWYRVGFYANGTTLPTFARGSSVGAVGSDLINYGLSAPTLRFSTADTGRTTTMPGTLGSQTAAPIAWWAGLS